MAGLTEDGFVTPRFSDVVDALRTRFVNEEGSGRVPDWGRNKVLGILTTVSGLLLTEVWDALQDVYDSYNVDSATGIHLENLCKFVNVTRRQATFSTVVLDFGGTSTDGIPAGSTFEDTSGNRWVTIEDAQVGGSATARASVVGPVLAGAGTITEIITPINGLTSVTNPADAVAGNDRETDTELRQRRLERLQAGTNSTVGAVFSALFDLEFIETALVLENDTSVPQTFGSLTLPPHSLAPILFPPTLTADQIRTAAEVIASTKGGGIESYGVAASSPESVPSPGGPFDIDIGYTLASQQDVDFSVVADPADGFELAELTPEIESSIEDYVASLRVGEDVRLLQIYRVLGRIEGLEAAVVSMGEAGGALASQDVNIDFTEFAGVNDITVTS